MEENLLPSLLCWEDLLDSGGLYEFESELEIQLSKLYNLISESLIKEASSRCQSVLIEQATPKGCGNIELRPFSLKTAKGLLIELESPYVKRVPPNWSGSRHLLANHWKIVGGSSPYLYDKVGFCAALCPSYEVAHQTLSKFGVPLSLSGVRDLSMKLADHCNKRGEENLLLKKGENLVDKRVVLSIDGGRTRTRNYIQTIQSHGKQKYQTPWCEPKLFVIEILDKSGNLASASLPIYGCRFGEEDVLSLLGKHLKRLKIDQAQEVQIVADGAPWIWNRMKPLLLELGVAPDCITETLDYYHAAKYVHELVEKMPKRISESQKKNYRTQFKALLWEGKSAEIVAKCKQIYKRPCPLVKRWLKYFEKHQNKTKYADYEKDKLMCGSGIIESAIRRIINLRFKNTSTFWIKNNVEKLYFLREALLARRWNILLKNLVDAS